MSTSVSDRLRLARIRAGHRFAADVASIHGWNENTYRSHENGNRHISHRWIEIYAKAFKVSESWLEKGVEARPDQTKNLPLMKWSDLPQRRARMSTAVAHARVDRTGSSVPLVKWPPEDDPNTLPVRDNSMVDPAGGRHSLYPGDFAIIAFMPQGERPKPDSICVLFDPEDGDHVIRKAEYVDRQTIRFVPLNKAFPDTILPSDSDHVIATVVGVARRIV